MMKFIAPTVDAAKAKAARALGEGVVVIAVRNLPSGDIEVTASDRPEPAAPPTPIDARFGDDVRRVVDDAAAHGAGLSTGARLNEAIEQRFSEDALARFTSDLSGRGRKGGPIDMSDRTARGIAEALAPHGFDEEMIAAIVAGARQSPIDNDLYRLETGFAESFDFAPFRGAVSAPIMLVGPTGAGKTSCSAKLSAAALNRGETAFMMTADVGRAGAIDQLKSYGDALGADYYIVETPTDVAQALRSKRPTGSIVLDTPGVSPFDTGDLAALKSFQEACGGEPVLVLPAGGDAAEYRDWAEAFREFGVRRMIVTKFDASRRVGAALNAAFTAKLGLAHFSETPFISEGLREASPEYLARRLLAGRPGRIG
jgi:flagellar biosynthesis protein FlhF